MSTPKSLPTFILIILFCFYFILIMVSPFLLVQTFSKISNVEIKYSSPVSLALFSQMYNIKGYSKIDKRQIITANHAKINISNPFIVLFSGKLKIKIRISQINLSKHFSIFETLESIFSNHQDFIKNCTTANTIFCDLSIKGKNITLTDVRVLNKNISWELNGVIDAQNDSLNISGKLIFSKELAENLSDETKKMLKDNCLNFKVFGKLSSPNLIIENPKIALNFKKIQIK